MDSRKDNRDQYKHTCSEVLLEQHTTHSRDRDTQTSWMTSTTTAGRLSQRQLSGRDDASQTNVCNHQNKGERERTRSASSSSDQRAIARSTRAEHQRHTHTAPTCGVHSRTPCCDARRKLSPHKADSRARHTCATAEEASARSGTEKRERNTRTQRHTHGASARKGGCNEEQAPQRAEEG